MQLGLRVDVDTRLGLKEGVPRLLELFRRHSVRGSFFVTFGPDHSGRAIRRIFRPSFIAKMWRTNPFRLYGFKTLMAGTFLPSQPVGEGEPGLLRDIVAEGHELGIHGYDHVHWQDGLDGMNESQIEADFRMAFDGYDRILGFRPLSSAAPGWKCTPESLAVQDRFHFLYASDVRGSSPFYPVHNGIAYSTLQIPTTLPTMDELLGRETDINGFLLSQLNEGLNLHTIHAEVEGRSYHSLFERFVAEIIRRKVEVVSLRDLAEPILRGTSEKPPQVSVARNTVPGRSGWVACQGSPAVLQN